MLEGIPQGVVTADAQLEQIQNWLVSNLHGRRIGQRTISSTDEVAWEIETLGQKFLLVVTPRAFAEKDFINTLSMAKEQGEFTHRHGARLVFSGGWTWHWE